MDDHRLGDYVFGHSHDGEADHDHDHDEDPGPIEANPIWQRDNVALTTVGIDIGSAGTQVVFSTVHLQRMADRLASRYVIVDRKTAYAAPVSFTPFAADGLIDGAGLGRIIDNAYAAAAIRPSDLDTGVVILTGEALRRENAGAIAAIIASKGGDFVTAAAGNHMEAMLAAYGSGAARISAEMARAGGGRRILNIDIGGGTTKLALIEAGHVLWTGALDIGGRLVAVSGGKVVRLDPAGRVHATGAGIELRVDGPCGAAELDAIAGHMAGLLVAAVTRHPVPPEVAGLFLTDPPPAMANLDGVVFSGGVGEYVGGHETRDFGDLGLPLGRILSDRAARGDFGARVIPAPQRIRATALGASEYSVQLSGQTSTITNPGRLLPRRNLPVLKPDIDLARLPAPGDIAAAIAARFAAFDLDPARDAAALAFDWRLAPDYAALRALADGIAMAMSPAVAAGLNLYVMLDGDVALTLGSILGQECGITAELAILDGLTLRDFDYVDLGRVRLPSFTVPVTVKSLLFAEDSLGRERLRSPAQGPRAAAAGHAHTARGD